MKQAQIALTQGENRYDNVMRALELLGSQIKIEQARCVLIKPNLVSTVNQLASTHVDALRAVLDVVRARYPGRILLAEGAGLRQTQEGFRNFGYATLVDQYGVELVDINADEALPVQVYDRHLSPRTLHLSRTVLESDYRISVGPPKTHDYVIVTLSLKNMIMGSLVNRTLVKPHAFPRLRRILYRLLQRPDGNDRVAMHQGFPVLNLNLAMLAPLVKAHLSVIDGFVGMEGAGPLDGDAVPWQIALAGTDALAVDSLTTHLMGFDPAEVGYLDYCRRLGLGVAAVDEMQLLGGVDPASVRRAFRPHPIYHEQREWHLPEVERWLHPAQRLAGVLSAVPVPQQVP